MKHEETTFTKTYTCAALLDYFFEKYDTFNSLHNFHTKINEETRKFEVYYSKQVMNPVGFFIGSETYKISFPLIQNVFRNSYKENINDLARYHICLESECIGFEFVDGPESDTCCGECEENNCQCESYLSPKEDDILIDDEYCCTVQHLLEEFKNSGIHWNFTGAEWEIRNKND